MRTINVLWTGGLDSTYLVVKLSRLNDVQIVPLYVIDKYRGSTSYELKAIREITIDLRNNKETLAVIDDVCIINSKDIENDKEITTSYLRLREKYGLGSQYDYLARYAKQKNQRFAVGLQVGKRSKVNNVFKAEGGLKKEGDEKYTYYQIDQDKCTLDVANIFSYFEIPTFMYKKTKVEEVDELNKLGLGDVLKKTWFCHSPVWGMPCGLCSPCKDALNEGMAWRVPMKGRILAYMIYPFRIVKKSLKKARLLLEIIKMKK